MGDSNQSKRRNTFDNDSSVSSKSARYADDKDTGDEEGNSDRKAEINISATSNQESYDPSSNVEWMKLPEEVWSAIFHWVPTKDKVNSRLVSKAWKTNVDLLSSFKVQVDSRIEEARFDQICEKRIQSVELLSLQAEFDPRFKFPKYVKELIVTTLVSPVNFIKCCKVFTEVQGLRFISTLKSDTTFDPGNTGDSTKILATLKKLKEVDVMIHSFAPRGLWSSETFNIIFNNPSVIFPHLTTVNLNMVLHHEEMEAFFKFLLFRRASLRSVTIRLGCISPARLTVEQEFCFSNMHWFVDLHQLSLESLHIFRSQVCGCCDLDDVLNEILRSQTGLTHLTADYSDVAVSDVHEILRKNVKLRSCKIFRVSCAYLMEVDSLLVLPEDSKSLQELALDFVNSTVIFCYPFSAPQLEMRFFDFRQLPASLRKLSVRGYNLPKEQFLVALRGLTNVEEFNVGDCLFRDAATRVSLFLDMCQVLGTEECAVRRFMFDLFETSQFDLEGKKWRKIEEAALDFGILKQQSNAEELHLGNYERAFYDFKFTKSQIREFVTFAASYLSSLDGDSSSLAVTRSSSSDNVFQDDGHGD